MNPRASSASSYLAIGALSSALLAYASGWGLLIRGVADSSSGSVSFGGWLLLGALLAFFFDLASIALAAVALLLKSPRSSAVTASAIGAIALGVIGLVGVALLGVSGLALVVPGVK